MVGDGATIRQIAENWQVYCGYYGLDETQPALTQPQLIEVLSAALGGSSSS